MMDIRETRMPSPPSLATESRRREDEGLASSQELKESPEAPDISAVPGRMGESGEKESTPVREDGGSSAASGNELSSSKGVFHASGAVQHPPKRLSQTQEVETSQGLVIFLLLRGFGADREKTVGFCRRVVQGKRT